MDKEGALIALGKVRKGAKLKNREKQSRMKLFALNAKNQDMSDQNVQGQKKTSRKRLPRRRL